MKTCPNCGHIMEATVNNVSIIEPELEDIPIWLCMNCGYSCRRYE